MGGKQLVNGMECRLQDSQVNRNAKSGFLSTLFCEVPGNAENNVGSAGSTLFEEVPGNAAKNVQKTSSGMGPRKKFWNLQAWSEMT